MFHFRRSWQTTAILLSGATISESLLLNLDSQLDENTHSRSIVSGAVGFAIYRILGNSLPPRHASGNTLKTLQFILKNEENFENAKKFWVLNRLVDLGEAAAVKEIITAAGQEFIEIPFLPEAHYNAFLDVSGLPKPFEDGYSEFTSPTLATLRHEWMIRHKSLQIVNINHARNVALKHGRATARWTLVLDGGVAFNRVGWDRFVEHTKNDDVSKFILIPMSRITTTDVFDSIKLNVYAGEEPQIALRFDSEDTFDETLRYGNANKTELFKCIGFPGAWDSAVQAPWDKRSIIRSKDAGLFSKAGLVIRLPTGAGGKTEKDSEARWISRFEGVDSLSTQLDVAEATKRFDKNRLFHAYGKWDPKYSELLEAACEGCMKDRILSVLDKRSIAPSGDPKDFICPPRYVKARDGTILDATAIEGDDSKDLVGFHRFLRHSSILAYGGLVLGKPDYSLRALEYLKVWMVDDTTRMNPHLNYAQYAGKDARPRPTGLVVARDLWLLPQTIDLLRASGVLASTDEVKINWWCKQMLRGLAKSEQFQSALSYQNNISTWAAVIVTSLSLHSGELVSAMPMIRHAIVKFTEQVGHLNMQHYELKRSRPLHYSLFNLAGWCALSNILKRVGIDLLQYRGQSGESLQGAIRFLSHARELFPDYKDDAAVFDKRIDVTMSLLGLKLESEPTPSFMHNKDWGFAPLWPCLKPDEN